MTTGGSSGVYVKLNPDGTATLVSGAVEIGSGAITGAAQVLAEEFRSTSQDVRSPTVDTQTAPFDYGAQGSRTAFSVGNACIAAARELRRRCSTLAAKQLDADRRAGVAATSASWLARSRMSIAEVAHIARLIGGGLIAHGTAIHHRPPTTHSPREPSATGWNTPSFTRTPATSAFDPATGEITIHRYVVAQDVGYAINPTYIEGQIEGGVAQGLGQALSEEIVYRDGRSSMPT